MTLREFSNGFDTLVNSYHRFKDFDRQEVLDSIEFDEYEKSFYLTKAQEALLVSLYNGRNSSLQSFEETEELRRYLSDLVEEAVLYPITSSNNNPIGVNTKSKFFTLPANLWFITYEAVAVEDGACEDGFSIAVIPVTQDEYHRVKKNPFRGVSSRRALRLDLHDGVVEIVSKFTVTKYYVRYLRKLKPIILEELPNGLSIEGISEETAPEIHETLHQRVLEAAVQMALQSKGIVENRNNENR